MKLINYFLFARTFRFGLLDLLLDIKSWGFYDVVLCYERVGVTLQFWLFAQRLEVSATDLLSQFYWDHRAQLNPLGVN